MHTVSEDPRLKCHACGKVHPNAQLVTLHDGRIVGNYSIDWQIECEANFVVRMPTLDKRRSYLEAVREKRGIKAWSQLTERIASIWKSKRDARQTVALNGSSAGADTPADRQHGHPGKTGNFSFNF